MRSPIGAPYRIVIIEGKRCEIIATRDIKAGEIVLQELPVLVMPYGEFTPTFLLPVPKEALEIMRLLHNAQPHEMPFTNVEDLAHHRLLETLINFVNIVSRNLYGSLNRVDV
jgi:hypothetical protein